MFQLFRINAFFLQSISSLQQGYFWNTYRSHEELIHNIIAYRKSFILYLYVNAYTLYNILITFCWKHIWCCILLSFSFASKTFGFGFSKLMSFFNVYCWNICLHWLQNLNIFRLIYLPNKFCLHSLFAYFEAFLLNLVFKSTNHREPLKCFSRGLK